MSIPELVPGENTLTMAADAQRFGIFVVDTRTDAVLSFNERGLEIWNLRHLDQDLRIGAIDRTTLLVHFEARAAGLSAPGLRNAWLSPATVSGQRAEISMADGRTLSSDVLPMPLQGLSQTVWLYLFEDVTAAIARLPDIGPIHQVHQLNVQLEWQAIELAEANARLNTLAVTDGLTGLFNRRALQGSLSQEFARAQRYKSLLSIVVLDIDSFKSYNDAHGHIQGDRALIAVANVLQQTMRETDIAARFGGDEFVLLLPETDAAGASALAERCRQRICARFRPDGAFAASLGVSTYSTLYHTEYALMEDADQALFNAKRSGRNRVIHFNDIRC